jgi:ubiquinone/menaquinone biosynthesis C-methylase UbiE
MRAADLYDLVAPLYRRVIAPLHEIAVARAMERVLGGWPASVLEVGIGPGQGLARLGGAGRRVVGLDISRRMLGLARSHLTAERADADLVRGTVVQLPFRSGAFDAVVSTFLLDLLEEPEIPAAVGELSRVLAGGGRMTLGVMHLPGGLATQVWMTAYRAVPDLVGRCRPFELERYLPAGSLRVIREERVSGLVGMRVVTLVKVG